MGKKGYLAMRSYDETSNMISSDMKELVIASKKLANHLYMLGGLGFGTTFLEFIAAIAAIYLLIVDRTNWRTNILTSLLVPYIFLTLPSMIFNIFRGEIGKWIAFVAVVLKLFFPKRYWPDYLEMPGALILLLVVAPSLLADLRSNWIGVVICLLIAGYLLQEHIRASGGFKNSFTRANGLSNSIGIVLLFVYPVWALVLDIL